MVEGERIRGTAAAVYVGRAAMRNLTVGREQGLWGWKLPQPDLADLPVGTPIVFGCGYDGGSPRVSGTEWLKHGLERVIVGRTASPLFESKEPVWPDERSSGTSYRHRVRIDFLDEWSPVSLAGEALGTRLAEALRLSALSRGKAVVVIDARSGLVPENPRDLPSLLSIGRAFRDAVDASGLKVPDGHADRVIALLSALVTKPFAILTGLSGSGKTQLALRLGEWFGEGPRRSRFLSVPVRPDWTGPEALFGYEDAMRLSEDGRAGWFVPEALRFLLDAHTEPDMPYLMLLDEMNLAHVERYFSDFLSGVESRQGVVPNLVLQRGQWRLVAGASPTLPIPRNVFVIGTVNVDETTYLFSPKVLDRATTFEVRTRTDELAGGGQRPQPIAPANASQLRALAAAALDDEWHLTSPSRGQRAVEASLTRLHAALTETGDEFGHRVYYESLRLAAAFEAFGAGGYERALDHIVLLKLLPRVHGSRRRVEPVLRRLRAFAYAPRATRIPDDVGPSDTTSRRPRLPLTADKVERMLRAVSINQFVSFTE